MTDQIEKLFIMGVHASLTHILGIYITENNYKDFIKQFPIPDEDTEPTEKGLSDEISFEDFKNYLRELDCEEYENFFYLTNIEDENPKKDEFFVYGLGLNEWSSKLYPQLIDFDFSPPSEEDMDIFNCSKETPEQILWFSVSY